MYATNLKLKVLNNERTAVFFTKKRKVVTSISIIMSDFSSNIVNQNFRKVYRQLEEDGKIKGKSDIAKHLGTYNHVINSILKGKRNITVDQINRLCEEYEVNANFLFGSSDALYSDASELPTHSLASKIYEGRNNITLVPQKAMAGYATRADDTDYLENLKKFSIPGLEGELVAFEISGDSMLPNITNGDTLVCERVERGMPLKDNAVYVIVTDVVVAKRIQQIRTGNQVTALRLISDNSSIYQPYEVELEEIQEIWRVKSRLTSYGIN